MPPIYPTLAVAAAVLVVLAELLVARTGIFRDRAYWITMAICVGFMIPVDGWLTKLSAPIVRYDDADTTGLRPIWDILAEEYVYAFALLTSVILVWERLGDPPAGTPADDGTSRREASTGTEVTG